MWNAGGALLFFGALGWIAFIWNKFRVKRLTETPLVRTGDVAMRGPQVATAKGAVAIDGRVVCDAPLVSPVTKTPCLMYGLGVMVSWRVADRTVQTWLTQESMAAVIAIDDGSGPVHVDLAKGVEYDEKSARFSEAKSNGLMHALKGGGPLPFGKHGYTVTPREVIDGTLVPGDARYMVTESCIPVTDRLYVAGKVGPDNVIVQPGLAGLIVSKQSRDELVAQTAKLVRRTLAIATACTAIGAPLMLVAKLRGA